MAGIDATCKKCIEELFEKYPEGDVGPNCRDHHFGNDWCTCPRLEAFTYDLMGQGEKAWEILLCAREDPATAELIEAHWEEFESLIRAELEKVEA